MRRAKDAEKKCEDLAKELEELRLHHNRTAEEPGDKRHPVTQRMFTRESSGLESQEESVVRAYVGLPTLGFLTLMQTMEEYRVPAALSQFALRSWDQIVIMTLCSG